jgi:hypothetical protein
MLFDGVDEYVDCGRVTLLEGASNVTLAFWLKPTTGANGALLGHYQDGNNQIVAVMNSSGQMRINIRTAQSSGHATYASALGTGTWHHVVWVYDGGGATNPDKIKLYLNGSNKGLVITGAIKTTLYSGTENTQIGGNTTQGIYKDGEIDEVAIYDYSLTSGNVTTIYNSGVPLDLMDSGITSPEHYWRMGDGSDTISTINDLGDTGGNDGTPTNMESGDITTDVP